MKKIILIIGIIVLFSFSSFASYEISSSENLFVNDKINKEFKSLEGLLEKQPMRESKAIKYIDDYKFKLNFYAKDGLDPLEEGKITIVQLLWQESKYIVEKELTVKLPGSYLKQEFLLSNNNTITGNLIVKKDMRKKRDGYRESGDIVSIYGDKDIYYKDKIFEKNFLNGLQNYKHQYFYEGWEESSIKLTGKQLSANKNIETLYSLNPMVHIIYEKPNGEVYYFNNLFISHIQNEMDIIIDGEEIIVKSTNDFEDNNDLDKITKEKVNHKILKKFNRFGGDIKEKDYKNIEKLDLKYSNLENINGFEKFENLETLDISFNKIKNLKSLLKLNNLKAVNITSNPIEDKETINKLKENGVELIDKSIEEDDKIKEIVKEVDNDVKQGKVHEVQKNLESYINDNIQKNKKIESLEFEDLKQIDKKAKNLESKVLTSVTNNDIELPRQISTEVKIKLDKNEIDLSKNISKLETIDNLRINQKNHDIIVQPKEIKDNLKIESKTNPIEVELKKELNFDNKSTGFNKLYEEVLKKSKNKVKSEVKEYEKFIKNQNLLKYKGTVDGYDIKMSNKEPIKIGLTASENEYNSIMRKTDDGYKTLGGKYNPETNKIELVVKDSGNYFVHNNYKKIDDIHGYDPETRKAIEVLISKNLLKIDSNDYKPKDSISRQDLTYAIVRLIDMFNPSADSSFKDVKKDSSYYPYISSSKDVGIINGYPDNTFKPKNEIIYQELLKIASISLIMKKDYRFVSDEEKFLETVNNSEDISDWLKPYIAVAVREGMLLSDAKKIFEGKEVITRLEAAQILYRLYEKL